MSRRCGDDAPRYNDSSLGLYVVIVDGSYGVVFKASMFLYTAGCLTLNCIPFLFFFFIW